jgi:hypothetical protein
MTFRGLVAALSAAAFLALVFFFAAGLLVALAVAIPVLLLVGAIFGRRPRIVVMRMRPQARPFADQGFDGPMFGEGRRPEARPAGPVIDHEP